MSLNLLPSERSQFASKEYWDDFFKKRGKNAFEWYGEYPQLCGIMHKYIKTNDNVLHVGCGNSALSADLYDRGIESIVNVDLSEVVISRMSEANKDRPKMTWAVGDVTDLKDHQDGSFSVVLDKGTLDALFADTEIATVVSVRRMFCEVSRVLKFGGRYVCFSLSQDFIAEEFVNWFHQDAGWIIRVQRVFDMEQGDSVHHMPLFAFVCTKFKRGVGCEAAKPTILEIAVESETLGRVETVDRVLDAIKSTQAFAIVRNRLSTTDRNGGEIPLGLYSDDITTSPRYNVFVVDVKVPKIARKKTFAVFIVPAGREAEWLFSTPEGRTQLGTSAGFSRLLVVLLSRDHQYRDMDHIKSELSAKVLELGPSDRSNKEVPFLSVGENIGKRRVIERGKSDMSGEFVIEEVEVAKETFRRLFFTSSPYLVQSEVRLIPEMNENVTSMRKKSGKKKKTDSKIDKSVTLIVDKSYLAFEHSRVIVASLALLKDTSLLEKELKVLLIGIGGGNLASYLWGQLSSAIIDAVEIDAAIIDVAQKYFGLKPDKRLKTHIADGIEFVKELPLDKKYDVIILDCDNKDLSLGISYPPPAFLSSVVLDHVSKALDIGGIFVVNFVCRNTNLRVKLLSELCARIGGNVLAQKLKEDINEIIVCQKGDQSNINPDIKSVKILQNCFPFICENNLVNGFTKLSC